VGLLTLGSKAAPKKELIGKQGRRVLLLWGSRGTGAGGVFYLRVRMWKSVLEKDGLPPVAEWLAMKTEGISMSLPRRMRILWSEFLVNFNDELH